MHKQKILECKQGLKWAKYLCVNIRIVWMHFFCRFFLLVEIFPGKTKSEHRSIHATYDNFWDLDEGMYLALNKIQSGSRYLVSAIREKLTHWPINLFKWFMMPLNVNIFNFFVHWKCIRQVSTAYKWTHFYFDTYSKLGVSKGNIQITLN